MGTVLEGALPGVCVWAGTCVTSTGEAEGIATGVTGVAIGTTIVFTLSPKVAVAVPVG